MHDTLAHMLETSGWDIVFSSHRQEVFSIMSGRDLDARTPTQGNPAKSGVHWQRRFLGKCHQSTDINCIIGWEYASSLRNHTRGMCRCVGAEYVGLDSRWTTVEGQERARGMRLVDHWHCRRHATKLSEPKSNPVAVSGWRNFN